MDFDDNFEELEKNATLEENYEEETGFGLSEQELKEIENFSDAVIFVIDCRESMMKKNKFNEDSRSNFETVIKAAIGFMKSKVISSQIDQTGVILYNCDKKQNSLNYDGIYVLDKLDRPNAETIKSLDALIDSKEIRFKPTENEISLADVFWMCHQQFKVIDLNGFTKRIFLFTNEEDPMNKSQKEKDEAIERSKTLRNEDIDIELFPMPHPNLDKKEFDVNIFFSNILTVDEDELCDLKDYESAYFRVQDLSKRIRQKEFKKRVQGKCMFSVAPNMKVGLKFFNLVNKIKKPKTKFLNKNTNKELKSLTKYVCNTTKDSLYRNQIGTYFPVKDKKVNITLKDMKKIKQLETPGMRLMGFKSNSTLKQYHNIRPSYFIYPDEKTIKGSSQAFHAMINSLIKKK